jgi:ubiquinone/menaquinone biosynthesis C-methylase UbiE
MSHDPRVAWRVDPEGHETDALAKLVALDGLRVLELGCGNGRLTFRYAHAPSRVLAVDPDEERIADARAATPKELEGKISFAVGRAEDVDAPPASFDVALFSSSL